MPFFSWPVLATILNALIWGLSWLPVHLLRDLGLHALWITLLTYCVAIAVLLIARPRALLAFKEHKKLWLLMLCAGTTNSCFNWAVSIGDVVRVLLLMYLMPVWALLLSWWLFGEKPRLLTWLRVALALCGVMFVLQPAGASWDSLSMPLPHSLSDVLALISGVFFAATSIVLNRMEQVPAVPKVLAMFGGGMIFSASFGLLFLNLGVGGVTPLPPLNWQWVVGVVLFSFVLIVCNTLMQYGAARLSPNTISLLLMLEVPFAAISSAWLGATKISGSMLIGGLLVMTAVLLAALEYGKKSSATP